MIPRKLATLGTALVVLTIGAAPILTSAADHLDAPALGGATANGQIDPHSEHGDRDINDVYVFRAPDGGNRTVLAMTVNPAINLFGGNFGTNVRYTFNIDRNGDNLADTAYVVQLRERGRRRQPEVQDHQVHGQPRPQPDRREPRRPGVHQRQGQGARQRRPVGVERRPLGPVLLRPDGFIGTTTLLTTGTAVGGDGLGNDPTDFFANLNTNAIVLSIPNGQLPDAIGVWATTSWYDGTTWRKADQMGRPAINTVFNPSADKDLFNTTPPSQQRTAPVASSGPTSSTASSSSRASTRRARIRTRRPERSPTC